MFKFHNDLIVCRVVREKKGFGSIRWNFCQIILPYEGSVELVLVIRFD
jgi:hypothetical protein